MKIILVDMDSVLTDFESGFLKKWREKFPERMYIPVDARRMSSLQDEYPQEFRADIRDIIRSKNFFKDLPLMPGATEALNYMIEGGYDVRICTRIPRSFEHCIPEKFAWILSYFGDEFTQRVIMTKDKTMIRGNILIDDMPNIIGVCTPEWEHILYDQPYNKDIKGKKRITWKDYKHILA